MHIEAELDEIHTQRLTLLQQRWQKPLPEVLAILIDWATSHSPENLAGLPEPMSIGQWPELNLSRDSLYGDDEVTSEVLAVQVRAMPTPTIPADDDDGYAKGRGTK
ncbi:hypothetical protein [Methylosarcina fibrata]|uniref:hypothetical protein n=1 Tax=Methylosarcina fibrata TaxID=105972 RepID=UPI00035F687A|nr:hypothetical protein [Methylosarcina fibrata]